MLIAGCITAVDANLPYTDLPAIMVATEVKLVASPAHPMAYLPVNKIVAGETVSMAVINWLFRYFDDPFLKNR